MKTSIAVFLMICLQVAMSPLCLCYGAEVEAEVAPQTCCHAPEGTEPAPCPHCDQELPITATAPVKAAFEAEAPEWLGELDFNFMIGSLWQSPGLSKSHPKADSIRMAHPEFPSRAVQLFFGLYLI